MHLIALGLVAATTAVFSHRDRTPEDPELVSLVATADREAVVAGHATTTVVRLEVAAATRTDDGELGVNLGLLLDTSGSMAGEPIRQARAAVHALVDELRPQDRLTVVTFDSRAQLVQASATIDDVDLRSLHARIDEIRAEGTTDLAAGLGTLLAQLNASPTVGDLDRIVIVGDGVPNDARPIAGQVEAARQAGYAITTLGVGLDYDEVLLGEMARNSGGRFHHLECGADLAGSFAAELFGAQRQIAANVSLQLSTGPGVTIERVVGHGATMSGVHQHAVVLRRTRRRRSRRRCSVEARGRRGRARHHAGAARRGGYLRRPRRRCRRLRAPRVLVDAGQRGPRCTRAPRCGRRAWRGGGPRRRGDDRCDRDGAARGPRRCRFSAACERAGAESKRGGQGWRGHARGRARPAARRADSAARRGP
ncbi:MAG: VWA domain-containing protein [Deltaproteobacteria bacterium]|nr:VWA domain-containing protein [Deltaproteobacteria bacterium]